MEEMEEVEEKGNGEDPSPNWRTKRNESITNLKLALLPKLMNMMLLSLVLVYHFSTRLYVLNQ